MSTMTAFIAARVAGHVPAGHLVPVNYGQYYATPLRWFFEYLAGPVVTLAGLAVAGLVAVILIRAGFGRVVGGFLILVVIAHLIPWWAPLAVFLATVVLYANFRRWLPNPGRWLPALVVVYDGRDSRRPAPASGILTTGEVPWDS